jgi:hypothetical protein
MQLEIAIASRPPCTSTRIQDEVSRLWTLLELVPAFNELGDDNQEAIEAQLSALGEGLTTAQTLAEFSGDHTEPYVLDAALAAVEWLWAGGECPSAYWSRLIGGYVPTFLVN